MLLYFNLAFSHMASMRLRFGPSGKGRQRQKNLIMEGATTTKAARNNEKKMTCPSSVASRRFRAEDGNMLIISTPAEIRSHGKITGKLKEILEST
jgi:hypothetical protein